MAKTVVFDVDGTLMDTNYLHTEAFARAFEDLGRRVPRSELHHQVGKGSELLIREFVEDGGMIGKIQHLHAEHFSGLQEHGNPLPGARELISGLADAGYPVWLATSAKDEEVEHHVHQLGAEGKISGVVNSTAVEHGKPAPDIFEEALRRAGASAENAVAVGDSVWDMEAAKRAGVRAVAVLTGGAFSAQELREAGASEVHKDCAALIEAGFPE